MMVFRSGRQRAHEAGFTLIETLVVLVIIGTAFAIIMPRFARWMERSYEDVARDVVQISQLVRLKALHSGKHQDLIIDIGARSVRSDFGAHIVRIPQNLRISASVGRDDRTTIDRGSIRFSPDGGSTGGLIRLHQIDTTQGIAVRINWLTGAASLEVNNHADY